MAQSWKPVRIFISSTFRDMHAERDYLVQYVFPELRERCAQRMLHLVDVDLRWGIAEDEGKQDKVLAICLDEIERCRPFFIGLLGERYGWVPPRYDVPDEERYDWVREFDHGYSITALEIYHGVLRNPGMAKRAFFYFRNPAFIYDLPADQSEIFLPESAEAAEKLKRLKEEIRQQCPVFENYPCSFGGIGEDGKVTLTGLEDFGQRVLEDIWLAITQEHPGELPILDDLEVERAYHDAFIEHRTQRFVDRKDLLRQMAAYIEGDLSAPLLITGTPGCGKSSLLANFSKVLAEAHKEIYVLPHFIGVSPGSTDIRRTLLRLCRELALRFGIKEIISQDYEQLRKTFLSFLEQAAGRRKVVLILDGLNQLDETYRAHTLNWLPYPLPAGLKLIITTQSGDYLKALRQRKPPPIEITVGPLTMEDRREIVRQTLWDFRKRLDERLMNDQMGALMSKGESDNPLYLIVACEELRVFGEFERVMERIANLPDDISSLFEQVLERLETDLGWELVKSALSLLACARQGLLESEMLELLQHGSEGQLPRAVWARLYRSLKFYLRPPGESGEGTLDFFHRQLAKAVLQRYMVTEADRITTHRRLAEYFQRKADPAGDAMWKGDYPRGLSELPYHQTQGQIWHGLEATLCNLWFIQAKSAAGMTYELVADYNTALDSLPEARREIEEEQEWDKRIAAYTQEIISYSRIWNDSRKHHAADPENNPLPQPQEIPLPRTIRSIRIWTDAEIDSDLDRIMNTPTLFEQIRTFAQFVNSEAHHLIRYASQPMFCIQQAYNYADAGPLAKAARRMINGKSSGTTLLLHAPHSLPRFNSYVACIWTLEGHAGPVEDVSITLDGKLAVSGGWDRTVRVWDLQTSRCLHVLNGHLDLVIGVRITPDGDIALSGSHDNTMRLWDLSTGDCLQILRGHTDSVTAISIAPDRRLALSAGRDKTVRVWDIQTGECLQILKGHADTVNALRVTLDGRFAVTGSRDKTARVWDIQTGQCLYILEGHTDYVESVDVSLDSRLAITGSWYGAAKTGWTGGLCVWDLSSGRRLHTLKGSAGVTCLSPDGRLAISAGEGGILRVWDIQSGQCLYVLKGHSKQIRSVGMTSDKRLAVTGSWDNTIRIWDLGTGKCLRVYEGHTGPITSVCLTPDGRRIVSASEDCMLRVWSVNDGKPLHSPEKHSAEIESLCLTHDRSNVLSTGRDCMLHMRNFETGKLHHKINTTDADLGLIRALRVTPDGSLVVSGGRLAKGGARADDTVRAWALDDCRIVRTHAGHEEIETIAITPDGRLSLIGGWDRVPCIWDLSTGQYANLEHQPGHITAIDVSPDGRLAVIGLGLQLQPLGTGSTPKDYSVRIWDLRNGGCVQTLVGHTQPVTSVAFTPDGQRVVSGSEDKTLRIWDSRTGQCQHTLKGHWDFVNAINVSTDGFYIISGSEDKTLRVWDIISGQCLGIVAEAAGITSLAITRNRGIIGDKAGNVVFLDVYNLKLGPPIVTLSRLWLFDRAGKRGVWDQKVTALCEWCGMRFVPDSLTIDTIGKISSRLTPEQAPCIVLATEAWIEPKLLHKCPRCGRELRFNPFIVDNQGRFDQPTKSDQLVTALKRIKDNKPKRWWVFWK